MLVAAAGPPRSNGILCYLFALVCISLHYIYIETVRYYLQEIAPPPEEFAKNFDNNETILAVLDNDYGHDDYSSPPRTNNGSSSSLSQKNINANKNITFTFPGIQERVQYYMGDWYYYNHSTAAAAVGVFLDANRMCREVPFYRPSNGVRWHDVPYLFGADTLRMDPPPPDLSRRQEHYFRDAWRNVIAGYSYHDHGESSLPARDHVVVTANIENGSTNHDDDIRVAMMLGDWVDTEPIPFPVMMKSRLAKSSYSAANANAAASAASMLAPSAKTNAEETKTRRMAPILCLLNVARHFNRTVDDLNKVKQTPWKRKKDMLVWRGSSTGHGRRTAVLQRIISSAGNNNGTGSDYSAMMDVGFFMLNQGEQDKPDLVRLLKPRMTMQEQLRYKYLLCLEGNDVSSGLKWMLYSNSVVFMTKPTRVSWAMEDKLVPWYHYVPVAVDYSDLPRKIAWARDHDAECRRISQQATEYVERLYASPEAKQTNRIIQGMIAQRYRALYGPALAQCAKDRDPYRGWCPNNNSSSGSSSIKINSTRTNDRTGENQTTRPTTTTMTNNTAPASLYTGPWAWLKPCENDPVNMRSLSNNSDLLWTSKKKLTGIRGKQQQQARRRTRSSSRRKKNTRSNSNNKNKEKQQKENKRVQQQQQLNGAPKMKMMRNKKNWKSVNQK